MTEGGGIKRRTGLERLLRTAGGPAAEPLEGGADGFPLEVDQYTPSKTTTAGASCGAETGEPLALGRAGRAKRSRAFLNTEKLTPRIAEVRAGRAGFFSNERTPLRTTLEALTDAQLDVLRDALLPPAEAQRRLDAGTGAEDLLLRVLDGTKEPEDLMALLEGAHQGCSATVDDATRREVDKLFDAEGLDRTRVTPAMSRELLRGPAGATLVRQHGWPALRALERYGYPAFETAMTVSDVAASWLVHGPDEELARLLALGMQTLGARPIASGIQGLLERKLDVRETIATLGLARAMVVGSILHDRPEAERAYNALHGGEPFLELLSTVPLHELEAVLDFYEDRVDAYGSNDVALIRGGAWPALRPVRTDAVIAAERRIARSVGLPPDALDDPSQLTLHEASRLSVAITEEVERAAKVKGDGMAREIQGRRFVSFAYYDDLYERDVVNPEHRYSRETFESWSKADARMQALAEQTGGRPLKHGELTEIMQELHRLAAAGLVETRQTWQRKGDLGRLRSRPLIDVTGIYVKNPDKKTRAILASNPYLAARLPFSHLIPNGTGRGTYYKFAGAWRVRIHVAGLDNFVRENEGKMPLEELAAEVHHRIVSIHPFLDGNGRTAKLMVDFLLLRGGVQPPVWNESRVLMNRERWPQIVANGTKNRLEVTRRYLAAVTDPASQGEPA